MAEYDAGATHTLVEVANRTNNTQLIDLVRDLEPRDGFLETAQWKTANKLDSEKGNRQAAALDPGLRDLNVGVVASVLQTDPFLEPMCLIEDRTELDEELVDMQEDPRAYRRQEDLSHMAFTASKGIKRVFYGDRAADPKDIDGIINREWYDAVADDYFTGAGDSSAGAVTSAYLIQWGADQIYLIHPRSAGETVQMLNKGKELITTNASTGARLYEYVTQFKFRVGLVIADPKCIHRIGNIGTTTSSFLPLEYIFRAKGRMKDYGQGAILYCHPRIRAQMDEQMFSHPGVVRQGEDKFGRPITMIGETRVISMESLSLTETVVT